MVLRSGRTAEDMTLFFAFFCPGGVQRVFRDPLELRRGPRRRGGVKNKNRETKVIHGAGS